jgi:SAM-dependent methyltransferase
VKPKGTSGEFPPEQGALRDESVAERYYDSRYRQGYMSDDEWPIEKLERVGRFLGELPLPKTGRVLDFGCGAGVFTEVLDAVLPGWEIHGTDLSGDALSHARRRLPNRAFHSLTECEALTQHFDLIFTHHVLEHVADLRKTVQLLAALLKPSARMLHILPCGNVGSFGHGVCALRTDGVDAASEGRFCYDERGHLRRLTTATLSDVLALYGFTLGKAAYADHLYGEIRNVTGGDLRFVRDFANPAKGVNAAAATMLSVMRFGLLVVWALRKPLAVLQNKKTHGVHNVRDLVLFSASLASYPVSIATDKALMALAAREWNCRRADPRGTEMYLFFGRGDAATK